MRCHRRILGIKYSEEVPRVQDLARASLPTTYTLLAQRRLIWLDHVSGKRDGRIRKVLFFGDPDTNQDGRIRIICIYDCSYSIQVETPRAPI